MTWAGFSGTEAELNIWLKRLKTWSVDLARRRRRPDLAEDIESCALELLAENQSVGGAPDRGLEAAVARKLHLQDDFQTRTDGDLSASIEDFEGSYIEEFVADKNAGEAAVAAALDGDPRDEGKDKAELLEELAQEEAVLPADECTAVDLRVAYGFLQREIAGFIGVSQSQVSRLLKRSRRRREDRQVLDACLARYSSDPEFSKLEVQWIQL